MAAFPGLKRVALRHLPAPAGDAEGDTVADTALSSLRPPAGVQEPSVWPSVWGVPPFISFLSLFESAASWARSERLRIHVAWGWRSAAWGPPRHVPARGGRAAEPPGARGWQPCSRELSPWRGGPYPPHLCPRCRHKAGARYAHRKVPPGPCLAFLTMTPGL